MNQLQKAAYFTLRKFVPTARLQAIVREYLRAVNFLRYGDRRFFREVNIEIGESCNRRCSYCPQSKEPLPQKLMTWEMFHHVIYRLQEIRWAGPVGYAHFNEPLQDERILDMVQLTVERLPGCKPRIYTNGDYLTQDKAQALIDAGVVNFCVTKHDHHDTRWNTKILPIAERFPDHFTLGDLHGRQLSSRGGLVEANKYFTIQKMDSCDTPEGGLVISTEGKVLLCCCDYYHNYVFGDLVTTDLMTIWQNPEFRRVRKEVLAGKPRLNACKGCFQSPDFNPALVKVPGA